MEIIDYENKIHESETGTSSVDSVYVPVPDDLVEEREEIPAKNQRKPKPAKDESLPVPMPSTGAASILFSISSSFFIAQWQILYGSS